jgi:acyl-CoA reductase-like NAD-dependent aldehyde dehydrogenase
MISDGWAAGIASRMGPQHEPAHPVAGADPDEALGHPTQQLIVDGRTGDFDADGNGFFVGPTLFDNVGTDMSIYTDEIFGPVLSVIRVESYEDALDLINSNPSGNGTAIFTNDGGAARKFPSHGGINLGFPQNV